MPIRTNRGRAAVYRKLWGWPLRSPRHLVVAILFFAAIVLFVAYIVPRLAGGSPGAQQPATGASASSSVTTKATTPTQGAPGVIPPAAQGGGGSRPAQTLTETRQPVSENKTPAKAEPEALDAALRWAEAFVNHPDGVNPQDWLNQLKPLTTDEYFGATLSTVDPRAVAQTKLRGRPTPTADAYTSSVTVDIPTDTKTLRLTLVKTDGGWRVNEHTEVDR